MKSKTVTLSLVAAALSVGLISQSAHAALCSIFCVTKGEISDSQINKPLTLSMIEWLNTRRIYDNMTNIDSMEKLCKERQGKNAIALQLTSAGLFQPISMTNSCLTQ